MPKKLKVQRKLIENKFDSESCYNKKSPRNSNIENDFLPTDKLQDDFLEGTHTPITGISLLADVNNEIVKKSMKRKRSNSMILKKIKVTDTVVEETPTSSLASGVKTFYCSQNLYESVIRCNPDIMQSIVPSIVTKACSYSQSKISQCSTTQTINDSKTISGLGGESANDTQKNDVFADNFMNLEHDDNSMQKQNYVMSQLYNSQTQSNQQNTFDNVQNREYVMTQLYDSNSFVPQNQQSSANVADQNIALNGFQSSQSMNGLTVNIGENSTKSDQSDYSSSSDNEHQNSNLGQFTPDQCTDASHIRKKIRFETLAETYYNNNKFVVEDNFSERSLQNIICEKNVLPPTTAVTSVDFSLINNPPTDFIVHETSNIVLYQQKLYHKHPVTDFNENIDESLYDSFSSTPVDADPLMLPPTLLLSNYCSEYDKAYTMKDLKPNQYRNYRHNESLRSLKEHLDSIIPPNMTLRDFYKMKNLP